jgi:hypothetical protein
MSSDARRSGPRPSSFEAFQRATAALHQRRDEARRTESESKLEAVRPEDTAASERGDATDPMEGAEASEATDR